MRTIFIFILSIFLSFTICQCDADYIEIDDYCFYENDLNIIQKMIDNSYNSNIDLGCEEWDNYCGSPNPYMDRNDSWFWVTLDGQSFESPAFQNENGIVEPLELGIQEWENGRLKSIMCGAYIYCQLSGPIPEEINELTELEVLRLEINYLSGFIPDTVCDLGTNYDDFLTFDLSGNRLCPPYPECITEDDFWNQQDEVECTEIGDINYDYNINIVDVIILISNILSPTDLDYQTFLVNDINNDDNIDVLDVVEIVNLILIF